MWTLRGTAIIVFFLWLFLDGAVIFRRKAGGTESRDRYSLWVIVFGNMISWVAGIWLAYTPYGAMRPAVPLQAAGLVLMALGILLRSLAIAQRGRFHTPNVAVLVGYRVVDRGLYRYIRHPSYLGALIAFFGWGLALGNWLSLLIIMALSIIVYLYRIHDEEAALTTSLHEEYRNYCRRTKRLIPFIF
jgi:protein-S-isoprenylcysteine O-methyltransferase Ste14